MSSITADAIDPTGRSPLIVWTLWFAAFLATGMVSFRVGEFLMSVDIPGPYDPSCPSAFLGCLGSRIVGEIRGLVSAALMFLAIVVAPLAYLAALVSCATGIARGSGRLPNALVAALLLAPFAFAHVDARRDFARLDRATAPRTSVSTERAALPLFVVMAEWPLSTEPIGTLSDMRARFLGRRLSGVRMTVADRVDGGLLIGREVASGAACGPLLAGAGEWRDIGDGVCATPYGRSLAPPEEDETRIVEVQADPSSTLLSSVVSDGDGFDPDTGDRLAVSGCPAMDFGSPFQPSMRVVVDKGSSDERTYGTGCRRWPALLPVVMADGFVAGPAVEFFDADPASVIKSALENKAVF